MDPDSNTNTTDLLLFNAGNIKRRRNNFSNEMLLGSKCKSGNFITYLVVNSGLGFSLVAIMKLLLILILIYSIIRMLDGLLSLPSSFFKMVLHDFFFHSI